MTTTSERLTQEHMAGNPVWRGVPSADFEEPESVSVLRVLGHGRAAEARLVTASFAGGSSLVCVEKVFRPGLLTRFIYKAAFQAPFGYQVSHDAILACFYRRRVAATLIEVTGLDVRVAKPLYVRFDTKSKAFVLAAEWINGRGIRPADPDRHLARRILSRVLQRSGGFPPRPPQEIDELLTVMQQLEQLFCEAGLNGTGWQVCTRAMVSTANLLRTDTGYVAIDLESGIPAVLVPRYLRHSLRLRAFPLFDDLDESALLAWIDRHSDRISTRIHCQLKNDVTRLIMHTKAWKQAEPAIGRNALRFLRVQNQQAYRTKCLDTWRLRGDVDAETTCRIHSGNNQLYRHLYALGLIPGRVGRFLQRLVGHQEYRDSVVRFLRDPAFRRQRIQDSSEQHVRHWAETGRLPGGRPHSLGLGDLVLHWLLARCTPRGVHRWMTDGQVRRTIRIRALLIIISSRFQRAYGQHLIRRAIHDWERSGRLTAGTVAVLRAQADSLRLQEYAQGFGLHLGLKLFDPLVYPIKIGGMAAFLKTGNPLFLLTLLLLPALRTLITLSRMFSRHRHPSTEYGEALLIGALPTVGSLAYPAQMYASCPELSAFLLRDAAARLGRSLPIYGGKDSRLEIAAIRLMDLAVGLIDMLTHATQAARTRLSPPPPDVIRFPTSIAEPRRSWDHLVDEQLSLLTTTEAAVQASLPAELLSARIHRDAA